MTYFSLYSSCAAGLRFTALLAQACSPAPNMVVSDCKRTFLAPLWAEDAELLETMASQCEFRGQLADAQERRGRPVVLPRWPRCEQEMA